MRNCHFVSQSLPQPEPRHPNGGILAHTRLPVVIHVTDCTPELLEQRIQKAAVIGEAAESLNEFRHGEIVVLRADDFEHIGRV